MEGRHGLIGVRDSSLQFFAQSLQDIRIVEYMKRRERQCRLGRVNARACDTSRFVLQAFNRQLLRRQIRLQEFVEHRTMLDTFVRSVLA